MSEMMHTPGPWGWTYDGSKDYSIGSADDPQAKPVAHVYAWQRNYNQAEANCNLIAAAPDLLAALERVLMDTCEGDIHSVPDDSDGRFCPADALRLCAAALSRARGREPDHFHDAS